MKYTYSDWLQCKFCYNDLYSDLIEIEVNEGQSDYDNIISKSDLELIHSKQISVLESESKNYLRYLVHNYLLDSRDADDFEEHSRLLFETINETLTNPKILSEAYISENNKIIIEGPVHRSKSIIELSYLEIMPLKYHEVELAEAKPIQDAFESFRRNKESWNHNVVEYPDMGKRKEYVEFAAEKKSKAFYELYLMLRRRNKPYSNTFSLPMAKYEIRALKEGLIRQELIETIELNKFDSILNEKYNLEYDRINWIGSKDSLYYFIQKLKSRINFENEFLSKWQQVANTFTIKDEIINVDNFSKSNTSKIPTITKKRIDVVVKKLIRH